MMRVFDLPSGPTRALWRPGPGPLVVLVHGAGGNRETWESVLPSWSWATVVAPDLPGRGGSGGPPRSDMAALAEWLLELVEVLPAPPILVGHSLGGGVALQAALTRPDALAGLALVSSGAKLGVSPRILAAVEQATAQQPFQLDFAFGVASAAAPYAASAASTPPRATLADWRACDGFDVRARLGELDLATLVVWGEDDALTPGRFQDKLVEALPGARRAVIPGAGHMLPWEAPEALSQAVRQAFTA